MDLERGDMRNFEHSCMHMMSVLLGFIACNRDWSVVGDLSMLRLLMRRLVFWGVC